MKAGRVWWGTEVPLKFLLRSKSHLSFLVQLWVSKVSEKKPTVWHNRTGFFFLYPRYIFRCLQRGGGWVLLFMYFLVYRGASHTYTHTYALDIVGRRSLAFNQGGFNWFKPPRDQQSGLPKCCGAREYLYHCKGAKVCPQLPRIGWNVHFQVI